MKFFRYFLFIFIFSHQVFAISLDQAGVRHIPADPDDDPIYGIGETIEIVPSGKDLDEAANLQFQTKNLKLPRLKIYLPHIKVFHTKDGFGFNYQYIGGTLQEDDLVTVSITRTGMYFLGVIVPKSKILFDLPQEKIVVGETFSFTTDEIVSNQGVPIWDGFPFFVSLRGGTVIGDYEKEGESFLIPAKDGRLSFELKADLPGDLFVSVGTEFSNYASQGRFIIPIGDVTTEVTPPSNLRVTGKTLRWKKSPDKDLVSYLLFYRVKGERGWNGGDIKETFSPVPISPQVNHYKLRFESYVPLTYELMMIAVDLLGQDSKQSEVIEYKLPIADFSEREKMIKKEIEKLENLPQKSMKFSDIVNHWAEEYINELTNRGVINGYPDGTFRPDQKVTRAELVKMALKAFGYDGEEGVDKTPFNDVPSGEWFAPYIIQAKNLAFISGYSDQTFRPIKFVNRAEGLKILLGAAGELSDGSGEEINYSDVPASSWYSTYVKDATKKGVISGYQTQIASKNDTPAIKIPLWKGMKGDEVIKLQNKLSSLGFYQGVISGSYDDATMKAVYDFQVLQGIVKTSFNPATNGSVGEKTRLALNAQTSRFFKPDGLLTRAEVSKILVKILELRK